MARKVLSISPSSLHIIETTPLDLARKIILLREGENEPDLDLGEFSGDTVDTDEAREEVINNLSKFDQEDLLPLDERCLRIHRLAEGKGVASLNTVAEQRLSTEQHTEYENQLDPLCRSIWMYLNFKEAFEDAESFHMARQFRDYGKMYDASEIDLDMPIALDAASVDEEALALAINKLLELKEDCTVSALNLPATGTHPASLMLIVRHGGSRTSVIDHRGGGSRRKVYFRPPDDATLIYTPELRQIEICAASPAVRQKVGECFAEVALGHDISKKPLTWKRFDLSRFRTSLTLPLPEIDGFEILTASVIEVELRLGDWKRKLSLRVALHDDITFVADKYLGANNLFTRAEDFSRVGIAVRYYHAEKDRKGTLNITITGSKGCNLQSNKDPDLRSLGYALLKAWDILSTFKEIETAELHTMFPQLVALFDRAEDNVTGAYLRNAGLDPRQLIEGGLLERSGRQEIVLIDGEDTDDEVSVKPSSTKGMVQLTGSFGEDHGTQPAADFDLYELNPQWLHETLIKLIKPLLSTSTLQLLDTDLTFLGSLQVEGADVPIYFARRLDNLKSVAALDVILRSRQDAGVGIVLSAGKTGLAHLGPNVVMPIAEVFRQGESDDTKTAILQRFTTGRWLALGGAEVTLAKYGSQSAMLYIPGKIPLPVLGFKQIVIFERLVAAHKSGSPDVPTGALIEGSGVRSPADAWPSATRSTVVGIYMENSRRGHWRLKADGSVHSG